MSKNLEKDHTNTLEAAKSTLLLPLTERGADAPRETSGLIQSFAGHDQKQATLVPESTVHFAAVDRTKTPAERRDDARSKGRSEFRPTKQAWLTAVGAVSTAFLYAVGYTLAYIAAFGFTVGSLTKVPEGVKATRMEKIITTAFAYSFPLLYVATLAISFVTAPPATLAFLASAAGMKLSLGALLYTAGAMLGRGSMFKKKDESGIWTRPPNF